MPARKKKPKSWVNPCKAKDPPCVCADANCGHHCCAIVRDHTRKTNLGKLARAREIFSPGTPAWKDVTRQMVSYGHDASDDECRDLEDEFSRVSPPDPVAALTAGLDKTLRSQEREQDLNRLVATIPALNRATDANLAMKFFYSVQCEARADDAELRFKAAIQKCTVPRFTRILRACDYTVTAWDSACEKILRSIDTHYLASAKASLTKAMTQHDTEDPSLYADRVMMSIDVYRHFAGLANKTVDAEELARAWVNGLANDTVRMSASVAVSARTTYDIVDALEVARVAHSSCAPVARDGVPLKSAVPAAPEMDNTFVQQYMDTAVSQMEARLAAMTAESSGRTMTGSVGAPTKYPCVAPVCKGALHRFVDCPVRQQCKHCPRPGHHSEGCFTAYPRKDFRNSADYRLRPRDRSPDPRDQGRPYDRRDRDRSPSHRNHRDRPAAQGRPKVDDRHRDRNTPARPSRATGGDRLNGAGSL
jgi:hypothetical protein